MTGQFRDYSNYIIYDDGRIYSKTRKKFMTYKIMKDGYVRMELYKDKKPKMFNVHRIVAEVFIPNPLNKPFVNHKDGNKQNNHIDNLEWVTQKENIEHAFRTGLSHYQEKNTGYKCKKVNQYDLNMNLIKEWLCISQIYRELGYSRERITTHCKNNKPYKNCFWKFNITSND